MTGTTEAVNAVYAALNARDLPALEARLDPDLKWLSTDPTLRPTALAGRDAVIAYVGELLEPLAEFRVDVQDVRTTGAFVVVSADHRGRLRTDSPPTSQVLHHLWRFESGRAISFRLYLDHQRALRSARARERRRQCRS